jgi:Cu/Ag efflux protein CusF
MRAALIALSITAVAAIGGCKKDEAKDPGETEATKGAEDPGEAKLATYTVRGKIIELPGAEIETIAIHHEAIPNFVAASGKQQPMMAMEMPFGLADGLDLSGIEPGDIVEVRFDVDFDRKPPLRISEIRELPADTELQI